MQHLAPSLLQSIVDDSLDEANETVIVTLSSPSNATLGSDDAHTYTITDNDSAPVVDFNSTSSSGAESISSKALTVDLSAASSKNHSRLCCHWNSNWLRYRLHLSQWNLNHKRWSNKRYHHHW